MKPHIRLARGMRLSGAYLLVSNAPWVCSAPGMIPAYGGSGRNAFFLYCIANGLDSMGRKASDLTQVERSTDNPGDGSDSSKNVTSAKLKRFSKWPLFWFVLMWVSGLAPVLCAFLSR